MEKTRRVMFGVVLVTVGIVCAWLMKAYAGELNAPAAPSSPDSAMYTLEDVYNRLNANTQATKRPGGFTEPGLGPLSTGHTMDEVYGKAIPTQVGKTGQKLCYTDDATGLSCNCGEVENCPLDQDGHLEMGVAWPEARFSNNGNGTVTDNLTGLIWLKDADCLGQMDWRNAFTYVSNLNSGTDYSCDSYTAGTYSDFRLPNVRELQSLLSYEFYDPALSADNGTDHWTAGAGSSFSGVVWNYYWSSTTYMTSYESAWCVRLYDGWVTTEDKSQSFYVWPVRGGQ